MVQNGEQEHLSNGIEIGIYQIFVKKITLLQRPTATNLFPSRHLTYTTQLKFHVQRTTYC